jgi:hypothetical protein
MWDGELRSQNLDVLVEGAGVQVPVDYDDKRGTFSVSRGCSIQKLLPRGSQHNTGHFVLDDEEE